MSLRALAVLVALALAVPATSATAKEAEPEVPPLNDPASDLRLPGKFVWADLFTSEVAGVRRFYGELFGWKWRWISQEPGRQYGLFVDSRGEPVAGVAQLAAPDPEVPYARWIYYVSVADVDAAVAGIEKEGGRVMLSRREAPRRGALAIVADPQGAPFGVLRSSSGDPPDYRAELGGWLWRGLFARDSEAAARFYSSVFGYALHPREKPSDPHDYILEAGDLWRAGISQLREDSGNSPTWLGLVRVEDLAATVERARELGGEELYVTESQQPGEALALFDDPFGAPFGFLPWSYADEGEAAR